MYVKYCGSRGRVTDIYFEKNILDYYIIYNDDDKLIYCKDTTNWKSCCLVIEIDKYEEKISLCKRYEEFVNQEIHDTPLYLCLYEEHVKCDKYVVDYIRNDFCNMLDIKHYKICIEYD